MSDSSIDGSDKAVIGFIVAVALVVAMVLGGIALITSQGQAQTCSRNGGEWHSVERPSGGAIERTRDCELTR
jgi:UPF0716 family protein affecting phage T7 exclusion